MTDIISTFSGNEKLVFAKLNELIGVVTKMVTLQDLHGKFLKQDLKNDLKADVSTTIKEELVHLPKPQELPSIDDAVKKAMETFRPSFPVQEIIDGVAAQLKAHVSEIVKT